MFLTGRRQNLWLAAGFLLVAVVTALLIWRGGGSRSGSQAFHYLHGALAMPAARPGDPVVFTLQAAGAERRFTLRQLQALPAVSYDAAQPQLGQRHRYQGVPLRDLAALAGLSGQKLRAMGSDDFGATIRADDYMNYPVMLAYSTEGQPISPAQKGPLLVVFPNVQAPSRFPTRAYGSAWVWFADSLGRAP